MRLRLLVVLVVAVLVLGTGALVAAVRVGAAAVTPGGGYEQSIRATGAPTWVGVYVRNTGPFPVTLTGFVPRGVENLRVLDARVTDWRDGGFSMLSEPLDAAVQPALDRSVPLEGFVLPPSARAEYQVIVRVQRVEPGRRAVIRGGAVLYTALGFDQGAVDDGVSCIRPSGGRGPRCSV